MFAIETILAAVCEVCGVSRTALRSDSRVDHIVLARQIACTLLHELRPDLSLEAIGIEVNREHTTVIHALRRVATRCESPHVAQLLTDIRDRLGVTPPAAAPVVVRNASWAAWWAIQSLSYEAVTA